MFTFLAIVHIIVSVIMVLFILLQDPKGGDGGALGMLGGGGSKSLFGNTGGNQFLVNVTKWTAIIFAFTSIYLAALSSKKDESVMDEYTKQESKAPEEGKKPTPVEKSELDKPSASPEKPKPATVSEPDKPSASPEKPKSEAVSEPDKPSASPEKPTPAEKSEPDKPSASPD